MNRKLVIIVVSLVIGFIQMSVAKEFKHVEPPFWWAGMKTPEFQLVVHGDDLSDYSQVNCNSSEVEIIKVHQVENSNYLFIDLKLSSQLKPGAVKFNFENGKGEILTLDYEFKERKRNADEWVGFDQSDFIYLIMPDRFVNGNPDNDTVEGMREKADSTNTDGRHGGDIQGIINKLDYLQDLGVTSIWSTPVLENNMPKYSYHGYAITDFYNVDPRHGGNEKYIELSEELHKRDMKLIMDQVFNHCGTYHYMIQDLPMSDWIHQHDEFTRSNYRGSAVMDIHVSEYDKTKMLTGWFDTTMPDLNQNNPFVETYLIQNSIWWIEYAQLDGIRLDTQPYSYKEMVANWANRVMYEYPNFNLLGEAWLEEVAYVAYFQKNQSNFDGYNSGVKTVFDFPLFYAFSRAFNERDGWTEGTARIYEVLAQDFLYEAPDNKVIFLDNHDLNRFFSSIKHDMKKWKMATSVLMTMRGTPMIYYATEILMTGFEHDGHGYIRKDFPGGMPQHKRDAFTMEGRSQRENEAWNHLKELANWRKTNKVVQYGDYTHFIPEDGLYMYVRSLNDNAVLVLVNNNEKKNKRVNKEKLKEFINGKTKYYDVINKQEVSLDKLSVPSQSVTIIEIQ